MLQITFYITYKSHVRLSYTSWKQWKYYFSIRRLAIIFRKTSQLSFRSWFYFFFLCCSLRKSVLVIFMQHRKPSSIFPRRNNPNLRLLRRKPTALFSNNEVQRQENYDPKATAHHLCIISGCFDSQGRKWVPQHTDCEPNEAKLLSGLFFFF